MVKELISSSTWPQIYTVLSVVGVCIATFLAVAGLGAQVVGAQDQIGLNQTRITGMLPRLKLLEQDGAVLGVYHAGVERRIKGVVETQREIKRDFNAYRLEQRSANETVQRDVKSILRMMVNRRPVQ